MNTPTPRRPRAVPSAAVAAAAAVLTLAAVLGLPARTALAAPAPPALGEAAVYSRLPVFIRFQLPDNGRRLADAGQRADLTARLKALVAEDGFFGSRLASPVEIVAWAEGEGGDFGPPQMFETTLGGASYKYESLGEKDLDGMTVRAFRAKGYAGPEALIGFWIVRDGFLILVWGSNAPARPEAVQPAAAAPAGTPAGTGRREILPSSGGGASPAAPRPAGAGAGKPIPTPAALIGGTWSWTSISRVGYVGRTGQLAEPGGMSAKYTFLPGGRYKFFFYLRQRLYGMVSESTTTAEGRVTFYDNGTFLVRPSRGHYTGSGSRTVDRPMSPSERKPVLWYWEWRTENGKRELYIGPAPGSLSRFRR